MEKISFLGSSVQSPTYNILNVMIDVLILVLLFHNFFGSDVYFAAISCQQDSCSPLTARLGRLVESECK